MVTLPTVTHHAACSHSAAESIRGPGKEKMLKLLQTGSPPGFYCPGSPPGPFPCHLSTPVTSPHTDLSPLLHIPAMSPHTPVASPYTHGSDKVVLDTQLLWGLTPAGGSTGPGVGLPLQRGRYLRAFLRQCVPILPGCGGHSTGARLTPRSAICAEHMPKAARRLCPCHEQTQRVSSQAPGSLHWGLHFQDSPEGSFSI